jgi:hypothetical protein
MLVLSDQGPAWPDEPPKYAPEVPCRFVTATADHDRILPALLLALTAVAGLLDAVCYLALGHVLTANMTGTSSFSASRRRAQAASPSRARALHFWLSWLAQ